ncbi:hypothetical protein MATL_G00046000 [Megalops atlanticus]|uniref:RRM domain-containing protein n=1 Tax=Megalops atlanticus TaxID=7932 RepID=A0A9D3Q9K8_MEGAT|nr:hypothetical protein MATL_G00046000 [Megalops atlanticus]
MMEEYPYAVTAEGEWGPNLSKVIKNKLQIYFQSKKKSNGGDCKVEYEDSSTGRATVCFKSEDVRSRVLAKEEHEITIENERVRLSVFLHGGSSEKVTSQAEGGGTRPTGSGVSEKGEKASPAGGRQTDGTEDVTVARALVLENVPEKLSKDLLALMVENICEVKEEDFSVELIYDINAAVVSFSQPTAAARFLSKCSQNSRFQQYGLRARVLEPTRSVRVENLPPQAVEDLLALYFEKEREGGGPVEAVKMIPEEQAAIITSLIPKWQREYRRGNILCVKSL